MSQKLPIEGADEVLEVASQSGLFQFRYCFIHKTSLQSSSDPLYLTLLSFLKHSDASKAYFQLLQHLKEQTALETKKAIQRFLEITPAEALLFRSETHKEGTTLSRVFTDLFRDLIYQKLNSSKELFAAMESLDMALARGNIPAVEVRHGGSLHRIHTDILYESVTEDKMAKPNFGDVYKDATGTFLMVLSQECDLATGVGRKRKIQNVLFIKGEFQSDVPSRPNIISLRYYNQNQLGWLCWDPLKIIVIDVEQLENPQFNRDCDERDWFEETRPPYKKLFALRKIEAERIQQMFASQLTRVGAELSPNPVSIQTGIAYNTTNDTSFDIDIYVVKSQEDAMVAICPKFSDRLIGDPNAPFIPSTVVADLMTFQPKKQFVEMLQQNNVFFGVKEGKVVFIKPFKNKGSATNWKP